MADLDRDGVLAGLDVAQHHDAAAARTQGNVLWGQPVSTGGASGWRRCCFGRGVVTAAHAGGKSSPVPAVTEAKE